MSLAAKRRRVDPIDPAPRQLREWKPSYNREPPRLLPLNDPALLDAQNFKGSAKAIPNLLVCWRSDRKSIFPRLLFACPSREDLAEWAGALLGAPGTPFEGGIYQFRICYPVDYPFKPPRIYFTTPLHHPNVNPVDGRVHANFLAETWSPITQRIETTMLMVQSLLTDPNAALATNLEAASLYRDDRVAYGARAHADAALSAEHGARALHRLMVAEEAVQAPV